MSVESLKVQAWDVVVRINQLQSQMQQLNQTLQMIQNDIQKAEADEPKMPGVQGS